MRKRLLKIIPSIIYQNQKVSILFFSFLTLFFIYRSTNLNIKTGIETFLPEKNKRVVKYKEILESFKTESNIIVLLEGEEYDVKSYADYLHPILSESYSVNSVLHKSPNDFMYKHGLKLLPYTLVDSFLTVIESNPYILNKFDLLQKIPKIPFPQYSIFLPGTDIEKDILLFSILISFSLKKLIKFG